MTPEEIDYDFIKRWLSRGQIKKLAVKHKKPLDSAYKILRGEWKDYDFVQAAYELAIERANTFVAFHQKVNDLKKLYEH